MSEETGSADMQQGLCHRLFTLKQAALELGVPYWLLLKATNAGLVPCYAVGNSRRRVLLPEVLSAIKNIKKKHEPSS